MGLGSALRRFAVYLGLVEEDDYDDIARDLQTRIDERRNDPEFAERLRERMRTDKDMLERIERGEVENLDPRIEHQVDKAQLHGLTDDERICLSVTPGQYVSFTDNYGNHDTMQVKAEAVEVTNFVRHRLAARGVRR